MAAGAVIKNLIVRAGADFSDLNKACDRLAGKVKQTNRRVSQGVNFSRMSRSVKRFERNATRMNKQFVKAATKANKQLVKSAVSMNRSLSRSTAAMNKTMARAVSMAEKQSARATKQTAILGSGLRNVFSLLPIAAIGAAGKQMLGLASDLQKVQNVVDTAFDSFTDMAEAYSKLAEKFGMSEFQLKKTSSQYMAMAKSLGVAEEEAAKMSLATAALTGDMASFFNVSQKETSIAVNSLFTGETETMKQYGVILMESSLAEYALANGIKKSFREMTAAEKVTLRYAYIMEKLAYVHGDATKTSGDWANQVRRTTENLKMALSTFGSGLMNILVGVFPVIDNIIEKMQYLAYVFRYITGSLFGFADAGDNGSSLLSDAAIDAGDLADNIEEAGENAKRAIAGFDHLNILTEKSGSSSSGDGNSAMKDLQALAAKNDKFYRQFFGQTSKKSIMEKAEKDAENFLKKMKPLTNAWSRFKRFLSKKLNIDIDSSAMDIAKAAFGQLTDFITEHSDVIVQALESIGVVLLAIMGIRVFDSLAGGIGNAITSISGLATGLSGMHGLISALTNPVGLVCIAIIAAIGLMTYAYQESEIARDHINNAFETIKDTIQRVVDACSDIFNMTVVPLFESLTGEAFDVETAFVAMGTILAIVFDGAAQGIKWLVDKIEDNLNNVRPFVETFCSGIGEALRGLFKVIEGLFNHDWTLISDGFLDILEGMAKTALRMLSALSAIIVPVINKIIDKVNGVRLAFNPNAKRIEHLEIIDSSKEQWDDIFDVMVGRGDVDAALARAEARQARLNYAGHTSTEISHVFGFPVEEEPYSSITGDSRISHVFGDDPLIGEDDEFSAILANPGYDPSKDKGGLPSNVGHGTAINVSTSKGTDSNPIIGHGTAINVHPSNGIDSSTLVGTGSINIKDGSTKSGVTTYGALYGNKPLIPDGTGTTNIPGFNMVTSPDIKQIIEAMTGSLNLGAANSGVVPQDTSGLTGSSPYPVYIGQPQNMQDMENAVEEGTIPVVNALWEVCTRIEGAIMQSRVVLDGKAIAENTTNIQNDISKITGKPVFAY